jgi:hypothetical protein
MGLDNFWCNGDTNDICDVDKEFKVCGGMLSGHGGNSFRGKVYSAIIECLTNRSLYEDKLSVEEVKEINKTLKKTSFRSAKKHDEWDLTEAEWKNFKEMWAYHAEAGHSLKAWY